MIQIIIIHSSTSSPAQYDLISIESKCICDICMYICLYANLCAAAVGVSFVNLLLTKFVVFVQLFAFYTLRANRYVYALAYNYDLIS